PISQYHVHLEIGRLVRSRVFAARTPPRTLPPSCSLAAPPAVASAATVSEQRRNARFSGTKISPTTVENKKISCARGTYRREQACLSCVALRPRVGRECQGIAGGRRSSQRRRASGAGAPLSGRRRSCRGECRV
ncbi:unnamed protein product, partial [Scytosiphon promiscuus]